MADGVNEAETGGIVLKRRGFQVYETNPSAGNFPIGIRKTKQSKSRDVYMVAPGTGEVLARGGFSFMEEEEVDSEEFVKVYLDGVRKYGELKKAGAVAIRICLSRTQRKECKGQGHLRDHSSSGRTSPVSAKDQSV
jgi:hypothetical protein